MTKVSDVVAPYYVQQLANEKTRPVVPLLEVIELNPRKFSNPPTDDEPVSFVPMKAVEEESGHLDPSEVRPWSEVRKGYTPFEEGDVIFAKITPCMENGKYALAQGLVGGRAAGSTEFHVLRPKPSLDSKYLLYYLLRIELRQSARQSMRGAAGQLRVPPIFFEGLSIPLPSLDEQRRIVAEIEERLSRLEAGVAALKRVQANLKRYRASVISEPFAEIENKVHTIWQTGREVFGFVTSGSRGWAKYYSDSGALFLRVGNIRREDIKLELGDIQRVAPPLGAEGLRTRVEPGDILITITADVGRVGLAGSTIGEAFVNQHVALARPRSRFNPRYLAWYLASSVGNQQLRLNERGATRTGLGLNDILAARIPYINNIEQDRIVAEIERRLSVVEELETQVCTDLARAERLRQAILHQAFMQPDSESTVTR